MQATQSTPAQNANAEAQKVNYSYNAAPASVNNNAAYANSYSTQNVYGYSSPNKTWNKSNSLILPNDENYSMPNKG